MQVRFYIHIWNLDKKLTSGTRVAVLNNKLTPSTCSRYKIGHTTFQKRGYTENTMSQSKLSSLLVGLCVGFFLVSLASCASIPDPEATAVAKAAAKSAANAMADALCKVLANLKAMAIAENCMAGDVQIPTI
ncbi:hypothetical protein J6590_075278 [Homalodisca vitripennis]|nr:hypothetical protein J6590_075278 [Homalodisca vitripennis]